jgi:ADP-heptose:LPS heptosyltransferase
MKLFASYDSPSPLSRAFMGGGDALSWLIVPRRPSPRIPLVPERVRNLLLLRLDGIGDNVCSWPALRLLREKLPGSHIALAVGPWAAPLYRECPWVDEVIEWDSELFGLFRGKGLGGLPNDMRVSRLLRERRFDCGIDLRGDLLSIFLLWMISPPIRVGETSRGGKRFLTDPRRSRESHEAQRTFDIACTALGLPLHPVSRVRDWPRQAASERAGKRLEAAGWDGSAPAAALCPLALWPWKQWPKERFKALALRLKRELGLRVIWFLEREDQAKEYIPDDPVFCGPLDEVAAALSMCRITVSNDSGLLHMAVAAGSRTVQLFGPAS